MRLLSLCIFIAVLVLVIDLSIAKRKKDDNSVDISEELREQDDEDSESKKVVRKGKNSPKKKHRDEDDDDDDEDEEAQDEPYEESDEPIMVCDPKSKDTICTCDGDGTLNCRKQLYNNKLLEDPFVRIAKTNFSATKADFSNNHIKVLEQSFIMPDFGEKVKVLDFSNNVISRIEHRAFDSFYDLTVLNLSSNHLTTIGKTVLTKILSLHKLFLANNKLKNLPKDAFKYLNDLTTLVLDGNPTLNFNKTVFPKEMGKLETLSLDNCKISFLPDGIFQELKSLKNLSLINNPITSIPKAINAIPNLFALDLSGTEISEINTDQISADHKLTEIYMIDMPYLWLVGNCSFCGLPNLVKIIMYNNKQLYDFHENAFGNVNHGQKEFAVAKITEFNIQNCNFSTLPEKLFDWQAVTNLYLDGNPFDCECSLAWLINDLAAHSLQTIPKCASPKKLEGVLFSKVSGEVCDGKTSASSGGSSFVMWSFVLLITVFGTIAGFLIYTRRVRLTNILYRPETPQMGYSNLTAQQPREDEEELQDDFHPKPDASPV